jgi:hypothetical protein
MKKIIIILLGLSIIFSTVSADHRNLASSGAQFLKIGVGSRYQAMGEASVAVVDDAYAMYWNPAGLASVQNSDISFTNVNYLLDISLNYFAYAKAFEDVGVFGFSVAVLSMGQQEITTMENQEGTGEMFDAGSYSIGVTFARQLNARFAFGGSFKYVGERIFNEKSQGFAFDFGTILYTGYKSLRLGMSISNMGPELKFSGSDIIVNYDDGDANGSENPVSAELKSSPYDLPMMFRVGLAYDFNLGKNSMVTFASELKHPNDYSQQGAIGMEYSYKDMFFIRSGYKLNYSEEGLTIGGGLITSFSEETKMFIDYAWQEYGRLESTQKFSIGFTF